MKRVYLILLLCMFSNIIFAQGTNPNVYKIFDHRHIGGCRNEIETIVLYDDGTFRVSTCFGNIGVQYNGGWWIKDTCLILQPSLNCDAPLILKKEESCSINEDEVTVEIYNEKGLLKYYGKINEGNQIETIKSEGCIISEVKECAFFRYFAIIVKGKEIPSVRTKKRNNRIEIIVLEPSTSSDLYLGKVVIPIDSLNESIMEQGVGIESNK